MRLALPLVVGASVAAFAQTRRRPSMDECQRQTAVRHRLAL